MALADVGATLKSEIRRVRGWEAAWKPLSPCTVKIRKLPVKLAAPLRVRVLDWPGLIVAGLNVHTPDSLPVQERTISPVNPKVLEALIVYVAVSTPLEMVTVSAVAERAKGVAPVPESPTTCGLPGASSVILTTPCRTSVVVGVKVTVKLQVAPAAKVAGNAPQGVALLSAKSPLTEMAVMCSGAVPMFLSTAVWLALVVLTP